jgi:ABC-type multidrug transport system fused ATPase/permease subunit
MARGRYNNGKGSEEELPKVKITKETLKETLVLFTYLRPYKVKFIMGLIFIVLSALSTMVYPFLLGALIDVASGAHISSTMSGAMEKISLYLGMDVDTLKWSLNTIVLLIFVQLSFQIVFSFMRIYLLTEVGEKALADMRRDVFSKLLKMPMSFFSEKRVGELNSRITSDLAQIQDTITFTLAEFLRGIFTLLSGLILIFIISTKLALVMLSIVPVVAILAVVFGMRIRKMSRQAQDQLAESGNIVQEAFQGISVVKAFTNERLEIERYRKSIYSVVMTAISNARYRGAFVSLLLFTVFGTVAFVMWVGAGMIQGNGIISDDSMTPGNLNTFVLFSAFIGGTMAGFADMFSQMQKAVGATQRIREILRSTTEKVNETDAVPLNEPRLKGEVAFKEVAFTYPSRPEMQVLKNVTMSASKGQKIAIVGPSGAGKSTIVNLLLRFYEPDKGELLFDGKPAKDYELSYLRRQMALVPQDVMLFGGTIYDNILYGKPGSFKDEVESAARKANAHDFITGFPEGYATIVGERGVKLSGGQRQRIAIARALLKDPAILVLDEATSSLDSESEKLVQQALEVLMKDRTSFVIAHRLSTVRDADRIIVIDKGEVIEEGTHEQLLSNPNGMYKKLSELQFDNFPVLGASSPV